jgi:dUTP pyrophosphatase
MSSVVVKVLCDNPELLPEQAHEGDAGWDLRASEACVIPARGALAVPTGVAIELPLGYEAQVRGRSGLAFNDRILAHVGTIDAGYRGEIRVMLFNMSDTAYPVSYGDRVAQLVVARLADARLVSAAELNESSRGAGGFGSSGRQ